MQWSLEDIYKKQVRGKIPPRKHLRVLGEAQISLNWDEEGKEDEVIEVTDKDLRNISGSFSGDVDASYLSKEDAKVISQLAKASGFTTQDRYLKIVLKEYDVNYDLLKEHVKRKDGLSVLGKHLTQPIGNVDLWGVCLPQLEFIVNPEDRPKFYNTLFTRKFAEGTVSVGAGELALAVLTEAKKGKTGDLVVGGKQVELKVGKGRVISARQKGFAKDRGIINDIASGKYDNDEEGLKEVVGLWNSDLTQSALTSDNLSKYVIGKTTDPVTRGAYIGALLLNAYGNHGNKDAKEGETVHGFDILLAVYQKGSDERVKDKVPIPGSARMHKRETKGYGAGPRTGGWEEVTEKGTFWDANYVNVKELATAMRAVDNNYLQFAFDGDGVYIFYPGSNTTAVGKWSADMQPY